MRILIVKTSSLGDILHAFPAIAYLMHSIPTCHITFVVEDAFAALVEDNPYVDEVIRVDTKKMRKAPFSKKTWQEFSRVKKALKRGYDVVFDLQGNIKSGLITFFAKSPVKVGFGWKSVPEKVNLLFTNQHIDYVPGKNVREDLLALVQNFVKGKADIDSTTLNLKGEEVFLCFNGKVPVLIAPGSNWKNKRLTDEQLQAFLEGVKAEIDPQFFFLAGNEKEKEQAESLQAKFEGAVVLTRLPPTLLQRVMQKMDHVIAMDSFPLHLAGESGVPTFSFFGPSSSSKYAPFGNKSVHRSFQGSCPYGITFIKRCPKLRSCPTGACLREVSVDVFLKEYRMFLQEKQSLIPSKLIKT